MVWRFKIHIEILFILLIIIAGWHTVGCGDLYMYPVRSDDTAEDISTDTSTDTDTGQGTDTDSNTDASIQCASDSILVNSLAELIPYLSQDDVNVQLAPGTYSITPEDVTSGLFPSPTLLNVSASNSTFCFVDVRLEIDTQVFQSFGAVEVVELGITGANTVVSHLTIEDIGDARPAKSTLSIKMNGSNNRVEGVHLTVRGSRPYGYGIMFGHGVDNIIYPYRHAAIVIHGDSQHLKDVTVIHRAYGHGIYVGGASNTLIEGCYIEGETRTTDEVLAEEGTGSAADEVDFATIWGYRVPAGYTFSLQQNGISAPYSDVDPISGDTMYTQNIRVIDCTIKNMNDGVSMGYMDGEKYIDNTTATGCGLGFSTGSDAQIVNSQGDALYGPLYMSTFETDANNLVDLTVLNNTEVSGNDALAYIGGTNQDITFRNAEVSVPQSLAIRMSGIRSGLNFQNPDSSSDFTSDGITINNLTNYPLVLSENSSNCTGQSAGPITDNGINNTIEPIDLK